MQQSRRIFFCLYPSRQKQAETPEGLHLRSTLGWLTVFHVLGFLISLTIIGFLSMMCELFYSVWCYSCYLTLRERQIVFYMVTIAFGIIYGFLNVFSSTLTTVSLLFYIINLIYYCMALFYCWAAYS